VTQNTISGVFSCRPVSVSKHSVSANVDSGNFERPLALSDSFFSTTKQSIGILPESVNSGEMVSQTMYHNSLASPQSRMNDYIRMKDDGRADNLSWPSNEGVWTFKNNASFGLIPETGSGFLQTSAQGIEPWSSSSDSVNLYDYNPQDTSIFDLLNI